MKSREFPHHEEVTPCSPRDRTFQVPKRKPVRKSRDGPGSSSCVASRDFRVRDFVA